MVVQNFNPEFKIKILEPISMFLAWSRFDLMTDKNFDPKICENHLQEVLKKVLVCYDETGIISRERDHIESIYLLFNLGDSKALERGLKIKNLFKESTTFFKAIKISLNYWNKNFYKVIHLIKNLPPIESAIAAVKLNEIRW